MIYLVHSNLAGQGWTQGRPGCFVARVRRKPEAGVPQGSARLGAGAYMVQYMATIVRRGGRIPPVYSDAPQQLWPHLKFLQSVQRFSSGRLSSGLIDGTWGPLLSVAYTILCKGRDPSKWGEMMQTSLRSPIYRSSLSRDPLKGATDWLYCTHCIISYCTLRPIILYSRINQSERAFADWSFCDWSLLGLLTVSRGDFRVCVLSGRLL